MVCVTMGTGKGVISMDCVGIAKRRGIRATLLQRKSSLLFHIKAGQLLVVLHHSNTKKILITICKLHVKSTQAAKHELDKRW